MAKEQGFSPVFWVLMGTLTLCLAVFLLAGMFLGLAQPSPDAQERGLPWAFGLAFGLLLLVEGIVVLKLRSTPRLKAHLRSSIVRIAGLLILGLGLAAVVVSKDRGLLWAVAVVAFLLVFSVSPWAK